ncbi:baseplate multidomain protein megatron, partial [Propylenella binzhouense]
MATLVLGAAGAALGSVFGGVGLLIGRAAGAVAGHLVDQALFGAARRVEGARLSDLQVQSSTEGSVLPRVYGKVRLAGQVIWATDFEEVQSTETEGGKGGPSVTTTEYSYFANFAVGLCEGPVTRIGRVWADGALLETGNLTMRVHPGSESQEADALIAAHEPDAPAYRGTAYVVFERLPLAAFGNRIPQLSFEVLRRLPGIEDHVRSVCVIPGSTEFGYDPEPVTRVLGDGLYAPENTNADRLAADWTVSLDELQALCPRLEWVSLVVAWFGSDLRAGACTIRPKVDDPTKETLERDWRVAGLAREEAERVSLVEGRPAYGGSPSDASVVAAIRDLKARGLKVALVPFILMDIPAGNALPDPYSGAAGQPAFPWRGRITGDPAPGRPGSADGTPTAAAQVADFLGGAAPGDFAVSDEAVSYSGPEEDWGYRRMMLHYAHLALAAGGVHAFLVGSEMPGLSKLRAGPGTYPFVEGLRTLSGELRAVLGPATALTYAADWSEYSGHRPEDGSGEFRFHLDPLWADPAIDAVGIDVYHPLSDWRDEAGHLDEASGRSPYEPDYLCGNVRGGEGYDWYYAGDADRRAQLRSAITDGAAGKPWTFRYKDLPAWWSNLHYDRPGGIEAASPTAWVPESKPIWLTELGCPAVDKGANQPNVFYDPKSAQSALPHFSSGARDDMAQRSYIDAFQRMLDPDHPDYRGGNPLSGVYGGRMIDPARIHLWAWDARPYPAFPALSEVWSDGANWQRGHWLNGRLGAITLEALIAAILADNGFAEFRTADVHGVLGGAAINEIVSARGALEPLLAVFGVDAADGGDAIVFRGRARPADAALDPARFVETEEEPVLRCVRAQETELANEIVLRTSDPDRDYHVSAAASRRLAGASRRTSTVELNAVVDASSAEALTNRMLRDLWAGRERHELALPPERLDLEPGDIVTLPREDRTVPLFLERVGDGAARRIEARLAENRMRAAPPVPPRPVAAAPATRFGPPAVRIL